MTLDEWREILSTSPDAELRHRGEASHNAPASREEKPGGAVRHHPVATELLAVATELLATPEALLTRTHLRKLGLERRAVDAVFRALPVVALPGYSRPMVRVQDYVELVQRNTFRDDRVRPMARAS
jgi:hypothetical protein